MSTVHEYKVHVDWKGGTDGSGEIHTAHSNLDLPLSVPPEFKGPGEGTNPEELLTSAIAGCYSITFGIIASNRKLPVQSVTTEATGEVEQAGANFTYRAITLRPRIVLAGEATEDQEKMAHDMAHKADLYCIITNAVRGKVEIRVEPEIVRG